MVDAGLLDEVRSILRRDLKLGPDASIPDDAPLVGGDMDLDSLDILLVVSSLEKRFAIKIPNEVVGRWIFQNVATLAKFVQDNRQTLSAHNPGGGAAQVRRDWLSLLPHGPEFRFVSRVGEVIPGKSASGVWAVSGSEFFLAGHFPGRPIVPGVLITEALAQIAGLAASDAKGGAGVLAQVDVKFETPVIPPAGIELHASVSRSMGGLRMCDVVASVGGRAAARGSVTIRFD